MKDILKKYNKKKHIQNIWIIVTSLALAIWVNYFIFNNDEISKNLKTNVNEAIVEEKKADLYIENSTNTYSVKAWQDMNNVENISFSLTYNSENIKIDEMNWWNDNIDLMNLSNYPWVNTIVINIEKPINIKKWKEIINFKIKKLNEVNENINIISANFTDSEWETFLLSTSGIDL